MNNYPSVICKHCEEAFESQIKIDPNIYAMVPNLTVGNNTFTCPACDQQATYSEREFIYTKSQAVELASFGKIVKAIAEAVDSSPEPLKAASDFLSKFEEAKSNNDSSIFLSSPNLGFLKKWIPDTPEKLAAYVVIGQLIFQLLTKQPDKPIEYNTVINQFNQTYIVQSIQQNNLEINGKIGRNEKCPCGGGKKYKHCHGKIQ
jgi:hypothetical protein